MCVCSGVSGEMKRGVRAFVLCVLCVCYHTLFVVAGGTVETLVVDPGYFRESLTSIDIKECFYEEACQGGVLRSEYCAPGYTGPCEILIK